jgi:hypothetical protein
MANIAFPLSKESRETNPSCPICGAPIGATFAFLSGGALADETTDGSCRLELSTGFLSIGVHGSHSGKLNQPSAHLDMFADSPLGQFERSFCSATCLRCFLNLAVDQLEARLSSGGAV